MLPSKKVKANIEFGTAPQPFFNFVKIRLLQNQMNFLSLDKKVISESNFHVKTYFGFVRLN